MDRRGGKEGADGAEGSGAEISQRDGDTEDCEGGALHDVVTIRGHQGDVVESGLGEGASEAEEHAWEVTGGGWRGREEGGTGAARGEGDALRDSKDSSERKGWRERSSFPVASRGPAGRPRSIRRKVRPSRRSRGGPWNTAPKAICGGRWGTVRGGGLTSGADGCTGIWRGVRTRPRGAGKGGEEGRCSGAERWPRLEAAASAATADVEEQEERKAEEGVTRTEERDGAGSEGT